MPNIYCPRCSHDLRVVACQCRGHIHRAAAWELGRWDWRPLYGSFSDHVRPMDIDFLVERNGRFLVFETKAPGVPIETGQRRALEALSRIPQFTVAALWGEPDEPEVIQRVKQGEWGKEHAIDAAQLWQFGAQWWTQIANRRRAG